ncbi:MAG: TonB family protein [Betaproteobacteria bacterium]|nr:TonB family protein [Betaproteobacteria bacterium]
MKLVLQSLVAATCAGFWLQASQTLAQGTPKVVDSNLPIAAPVYTARPRVLPLLSDGKKVVIQVSATIGDNGVVIDLVFVAKQEDAEFIDALKSVIGNWRFRPAVRDCKPTSSPQRFAVWFESGKDGTELSISLPNAQQEPGVPGRVSGSTLITKRPIFETSPALYYPLEARKLGVEGEALYLMSVKPDGSIESGHVAYSFPLPAFGPATERAFKNVQFKPLKGADIHTEQTCVIVPVRFCMEERFVTHRLPGCERLRTRN